MRAGGAVPAACLPLSPRLFAKIDVENINSNVATFIRTLVVLFSFVVSLPATGQLVQPSTISGRTWTFLIRSGLGTGASRLCYFRAPNPGPASLVAPVDILNVVLVVIFGALAFGEWPFGRSASC